MEQVHPYPFGGPADIAVVKRLLRNIRDRRVNPAPAGLQNMDDAGNDPQVINTSNASNEKIGYLPRKLATEGSGPFENEAIGDLAYYAPWGNLIIYYGPYRYSKGLIRLGKLDDDCAPLLQDGAFNLRIDQLPPLSSD